MAGYVPRRRLAAKGRTEPSDMLMTLNTHDYDSQLLDYEFIKRRDDEELLPPQDFDTVVEEIERILPHMKLEFYSPGDRDYIEPEVLRGHVRSTIDLLRRQKGQHLDPTDSIDTEDLLPRVWRFVRKYELSAAELFYEQLAAITWSGPCRQGRSKRIAQFYFPHMLIEGDPVYEACRKP